MSLSNELDILFSPSIRSQAQTIKPETVDALAVNEAVGALLRLKGKGGVPPQAGGWRDVSVPQR